jgi:hypothetical protein
MILCLTLGCSSLNEQIKDSTDSADYDPDIVVNSVEETSSHEVSDVYFFEFTITLKNIGGSQSGGLELECLCSCTQCDFDYWQTGALGPGEVSGRIKGNGWVNSNLVSGGQLSLTILIKEDYTKQTWSETVSLEVQP